MNALLLVDIQNDFLPTGALAVPDGDAVIPVVNRLASSPRFDLVLATQDWHPPHHGSFAANHPGKKPGDVIDLGGIEQILWPVHCVQNTPGAEFAPGFHRTRIKQIFRKGTDPYIDSYSALFDNAHRESTGLAEYLRAHHVEHLIIAGLATDYCVKFTALDAREAGFRTTVLADACRAVNARPGDDQRALATIRASGAAVTSIDDFLYSSP